MSEPDKINVVDLVLFCDADFFILFWGALSFFIFFFFLKSSKFFFSITYFFLKSGQMHQGCGIVFGFSNKFALQMSEDDETNTDMRFQSDIVNGQLYIDCLDLSKSTMEHLLNFLTGKPEEVNGIVAQWNIPTLLFLTNLSLKVRSLKAWQLKLHSCDRISSSTENFTATTKFLSTNNLSSLDLHIDGNLSQWGAILNHLSENCFLAQSLHKLCFSVTLFDSVFYGKQETTNAKIRHECMSRLGSVFEKCKLLESCQIHITDDEGVGLTMPSDNVQTWNKRNKQPALRTETTKCLKNMFENVSEELDIPIHLLELVSLQTIVNARKLTLSCLHAKETNEDSTLSQTTFFKCLQKSYKTLIHVINRSRDVQELELRYWPWAHMDMLCQLFLRFWKAKSVNWKHITHLTYYFPDDVYHDTSKLSCQSNTHVVKWIKQLYRYFPYLKCLRFVGGNYIMHLQSHVLELLCSHCIPKLLFLEQVTITGLTEVILRRYNCTGESFLQQLPLFFFLCIKSVELQRKNILTFNLCGKIINAFQSEHSALSLPLIYRIVLEYCFGEDVGKINLTPGILDWDISYKKTFRYSLRFVTSTESLTQLYKVSIADNFKNANLLQSQKWRQFQDKCGNFDFSVCKPSWQAM
ncbi:hypothetical protein RFI_04431 [Reticulomyxa filosa]|uniref:Uncharacterized protein n=1 Tax=Reticulomyxa filosa TaxID=46433 RepID=X6P2A4_RETFI|nr:hypothetical protein RFI_04431 [Reticulomyxa filosa]|eukprot:ETO32685.1 hypothetical protein RFI_04431 [Reticulomyxa filosa]